jgi:hypothetical protein
MYGPQARLNILVQGSTTRYDSNVVQPETGLYFNSPPKNGGAERDRTVDPLLAKQVLSQLSYSPIAHQYN